MIIILFLLFSFPSQMKTLVLCVLGGDRGIGYFM